MNPPNPASKMVCRFVKHFGSTCEVEPPLSETLLHRLEVGVRPFRRGVLQEAVRLGALTGCSRLNL